MTTEPATMTDLENCRKLHAANASACRERCDKCHDAIFGNGKPGLRQDVHDLKLAEAIKIALLKWILGGVGMVGAGVVLILVELYLKG